MQNGEDWLLRPVLAGCLSYEALKDCSVSLYDVLKLNDALDVQAENQERLTPRRTG
jgi:hypothetical protein